MNKAKKQNKIAERRVRRTRAKLFGTAQSPRLSVFRSGKYTYAQLIDDQNGKTVFAADTREIKKAAGSEKDKIAKVDKATILGETIGKKAKEIKIKSAVFDRGGRKYHGRIKAVAEGARKEGLQI